MSTIRHPVQNNHGWIYAAAATALVAGLLIVLMTTVFEGSESVPTTPGQNIGHGTLKHAGRVYAAPCFAGHPNMSIELARSGCRA